MSEFRTPEEDTIGAQSIVESDEAGPPAESGEKPESDDAEQPVEPTGQPD